MINTLILDDEHFEKCKTALKAIENNLEDTLNILNEGNVSYAYIEKILNTHQADIDLIIIDLMFEKEQNGLEILELWADENPNINFGIIAISNYTNKEAAKVLGHYAVRFGRNFLGLVPKNVGDTFQENLLRVIRSFTNAPFVRGGDNYFSTELLANKFNQFTKCVQIMENGVEQFKFSDIVCIQRFKENKGIKIYLNDGECYEGTPRVSDDNYNDISFFENFCYDFAHLEYNFEIEVEDGLIEQQSKEFIDWWEEYKKGNKFETQKSEQLGLFTNGYKDRIATEIEAKLHGQEEIERRVFLCLGRGLAINPLYLQKEATKNKERYHNLSRSVHEEIFIALGYGTNYGRQIGRHLPIDSEKSIKSFVSIHNIGLLYYLPLYGEKREFSIRENSLKDGKVTIRLRDAFSQRVFVYEQLCSNRWKHLFQQLAKYHNCY